MGVALTKTPLEEGDRPEFLTRAERQLLQKSWAAALAASPDLGDIVFKLILVCSQKI